MPRYLCNKAFPVDNRPWPRPEQMCTGLVTRLIVPSSFENNPVWGSREQIIFFAIILLVFDLEYSMKLSNNLE